MEHTLVVGGGGVRRRRGFLPQRGSEREDAWGSPGRGGFFLEKLMMRLIFLPAALLMEPVSSERAPFFAFPAEGNNRGGGGGGLY